MARHRKSNATAASKDMSATRRRPPQPTSPGNGVPPGTREIDVSTALKERQPDSRGKMTLSRAIALTGIAINSALPAIVSWGLTMGLIFGGCCSNVFALEAIVKQESESGLLITFVQFVLVALFTMPPHLSRKRGPTFLKPRAVPLMKWIPNTIMFFTVNMMNNFAFGYNISVPVHIILRSGGSVTTMLVGYLWGKRYTRGQVMGVVMLTIGVIVAAMADAQSKGKMSSDPSSASNSTANFATGLFILFFAQLLSAIMGIYVQNIYAEYGPHWHENLFYSHFLSIPLFAPFLPGLWTQFLKLMDSPNFTLLMPAPGSNSMQTEGMFGNYLSFANGEQEKAGALFAVSIPIAVLMLGLNSLTQFACIRGVNLLGARMSALGVTVVLNLRKLVSLFASIWLFGNKLPPGVALGALIVFSGAAVYSWGGGKKPAKRPPPTENGNGKAKAG